MPVFLNALTAKVAETEIYNSSKKKSQEKEKKRKNQHQGINYKDKLRKVKRPKKCEGLIKGIPIREKTIYILKMEQ